MNKIDVIYILGRAFTGSTMLGMLLGCHPKIANTGELFYLPRARSTKKFRCGCGEYLTDCHFWQRTFSDYESELGRWTKNSHDIGELKEPYCISPLRKYSSIFLWGYKRCFTHGEISEYGYRNQLLFREILRQTKKSHVVDVSKNPYRLFHLAQSGLFNIKVIYLYRDGRSSITSFKKRPKLYKGILDRMFRIHMGAFITQRLLKKYFRRSDYYGIRYESLTLNFDYEMTSLFEFLDVSTEESSHRYWENKDQLRGLLSSNISHSIGGNADVRFDQTEVLNKDSWTTSLTKYEKTVYWLLGGGLSNWLFNRRFLGSIRKT